MTCPNSQRSPQTITQASSWTGCYLQRCGSSGISPDGELTLCQDPPAACNAAAEWQCWRRISRSGLQSHLACRYNRMLRKLNRKQRLRLTAEAYPAPVTFFTQSGLDAALAAGDPKLDQSAAADVQSLPTSPERPAQPGAATTSSQPGTGADGAMHLEMQVSASSFTGLVCHAAVTPDPALRQDSSLLPKILVPDSFGPLLLASQTVGAQRACCTASQGLSCSKLPSL